MKDEKLKRARFGWLRAWAVQIVVMTVVSTIAAASYGVEPWALNGVLTWIVVPAFGAWTACRAVRSGLNNYLAWIAPPACLFAAHYLIWRFAPSAGAALLCAFISLVGAAAGEVIVQREGHKTR